ncbi:MAG: HAMP domain-containing protein [Deltaproteobacteria bacterium]|nr:HAMP domain-containing protein [Deltaproteobacteria bacterium]
MSARTRWMKSQSLRTKAMLLMACTLALMMLVVTSLVYDRVAEQLMAAFRARGAVITRNLAASSSYDVVARQSSEALGRIIRLMEQNPEIEYAFIIVKEETSGRPAYHVLASQLRRRMDLERLIEHHLINLGVPVEQEGVLGFSEPVRVGGGYDAVGEDSAAGASVDVGGKAQPAIAGYVCMGLSTEELESQKLSVLLTLIAVLSGVFLAFIVLLFLASDRINRRVKTMLAAARNISSGDLSGGVLEVGQDEIGVIAFELNRISSNLNDMMQKISSVSSKLAQAVDQITDHTREVVEGATHQVASVDDTSTAMSEMLISIRGIAENVEVLAGSAEESSSSILEMAATNDEMADNIHALAASVEQTTVSIEQMTRSVKEVARSTGDLSAATEQTSATMREMDVSISEVETNANLTAELSEEVRLDAEHGAEAVKQTIQGINRINDSTRQAFSVMASLGKKVQAIGQVLTVIDDVAEQTNLLALNAAIIAAQAGERGKGFAVVADEIKDLAERTAASTSEIAGLIQSVQTETKNVIGAMHRGMESVDEGVTLSAEAESALRKILDSSTKSTRMAREIARATVEQARSSKEVTSSIQRIAETVHKIADSTAEQARGSEQIMSSADRMRDITKHVHGSSREQARGSKQITLAIENISEMVNHLNRAQREQARGAEQIMKAMERIKEIAEHHSASMGRMKATVSAVAEQADLLRKAISRFTL